ncbi:hypothetical protein HY772_09970 [Candidatus Woesearchaeota archaeon]|nr:hypothetical protein [Candidatus Woesearchaeota archaeon]
MKTNIACMNILRTSMFLVVLIVALLLFISFVFAAGPGQPCYSDGECNLPLFCNSVSKVCDFRDLPFGECAGPSCGDGQCSYCKHGITDSACSAPTCGQYSDVRGQFDKICVDVGPGKSTCNIDDADVDQSGIKSDCDFTSSLCSNNCDADGDGFHDNVDNIKIFSDGKTGLRDGFEWDCKDTCIDRDGDGSCAKESVKIVSQEWLDGSFPDSNPELAEVKNFIISLYKPQTVDSSKKDSAVYDRKFCASPMAAVFPYFSGVQTYCSPIGLTDNGLFLNFLVALAAKKDPFDCDDTDAAVRGPNKDGFLDEDNSCDLKDNDCDGKVDECSPVGGKPRECFYENKNGKLAGDCVVKDADGDGYLSVQYGGDDCNDDPTKDGKSYNPGVYDGYKYKATIIVGIPAEPPPPDSKEPKPKGVTSGLAILGSPPVETSPAGDSSEGNLITGEAVKGGSQGKSEETPKFPVATEYTLGDNNCNGIIETLDPTDDNDNVPKQFDECIEKDGIVTGGKNFPRTPPPNALINAKGCSISTVTGRLPGWSAGPNSAVAYVVKDDSNPNPGKNALYVKSLLKDDFINYTAKGEGNTTYTFSFWYRTEAGVSITLTAFEPVSGAVLLQSFLSESMTWTQASFTLAKTSGKSTDLNAVRIEFFMSNKDAVFYLDNLQFENALEPTAYNDFKYEYGCCPKDYCWSGEVEATPGWVPHCVQDDFYEKNVLFPALGTSLATSPSGLGADGSPQLKNGYRCIGGQWKFQKIKFSELYDAAGFCPEDNQCFHYNGTPTTKVEEACVSTGDVRSVGVQVDPAGKKPSRLESFYCYQGNWTTRTKAIALALLSFTKPSDKYTIFCDRASHALNALEQETGASLPSVTEESPIRGLGDIGGGNIVPYVKGVTDEFCVLRLNDQVIAGVSLDVNISVPPPALTGGGELKGLEPGKVPAAPAYSFIEALKNDKTYCAGVVDAAKDEFKPCKNKDVYYNPHLRSVIFTKVAPGTALQDVPFPEGAPTGFIDKAFDLLKKLFTQLLNVFGLAKGKAVETTPLESQLDFVRKAGDFDKLYISNFLDGGKQKMISAVRETRVSASAGGKLRTFLSANYQNYKTDICNYFNFRIAQAGDVIRSQISNDDIHCDPIIYNQTDWAYSVYVEMPKLDENYAGSFSNDFPVLWNQGADNFWNDITAKIRSQAADATPPNAPVPVIDKVEVSDSKPSQLVPVSITPVITKEPEDIIARTWYFGDGTSYTTWFNLSAEHAYQAASPLTPYTVTVYAMNKYFKIAKDESTKLTVTPKVSVDIATNPSAVIPPGGTLQVQAIISNGKPPYNLVWDFGNGTESSFTDTLQSGPKVPPQFDAQHQVKYKPGCGKYTVSVEVVDKDGITPATKNKEIIQDC